MAEQLPRAEDMARRYRAPQAYWPELMLMCARAHAAIGDGAGRRRCLHDASAWIEQVARLHVPPEFRASFLERNPVNLAVRAELAQLSP